MIVGAAAIARPRGIAWKGALALCDVLGRCDFPSIDPAGKRRDCPLIDSTAKTQALDELLVLLGLRRLQVIEELAALVHELHEAAPRGMIALVGGKVLAEAIDALREERNLYFGGTGIRLVSAKLRDDSAFSLTG